MILDNSIDLQAYPFFDVSRETLNKFHLYYQLLKKWNKQVNLVQELSLNNFWLRHVMDSAQLSLYLPHQDAHIIDVGSGAGFPGMVLAMMGYRQCTLCESHTKKCLFLEEVARITETPVIIANKRLESMETNFFDVVTSRACDDLSMLLSYMKIVSRETSMGLFLKSTKVYQELEIAKKQWVFDYECYPSKTSDTGVVIKITNLFKK
jgi:16S rRNA (guanine527-N7)-methyltransferase